MAYVETPVSLPPVCRGAVAIVADIPTRLTVSVKMETPGLVVLADLWDQGWRAYLGGQPVHVVGHQRLGITLPAALQHALHAEQEDRSRGQRQQQKERDEAPLQ